MVLDTIYLTRHGSRANWSGSTPNVHPNGRTPPDTPLSDLGEIQSEELASHLMTLDPPVDRVVSSPFCRCIQTVQPFVDKVKQLQGRDIQILGEHGLGEWYGMYRTKDPVPASLDTLRSFFPTYTENEKPLWIPATEGESIVELHDRAAYTLAGIIQQFDKDPAAPKSVLICTHAATFMALSRALTGRFPEDISAQDFHPWTASLSTFKRKIFEGVTTTFDKRAGDTLPKLDWQHWDGIGGLWECVSSGDCSFLSGGEDRGWRFSGKESFSHSLTAHGIDAGTGLGIISEGGKK